MDDKKEKFGLLEFIISIVTIILAVITVYVLS